MRVTWTDEVERKLWVEGAESMNGEKLWECLFYVNNKYMRIVIKINIYIFKLTTVNYFT